MQVFWKSKQPNKLIIIDFTRLKINLKYGSCILYWKKKFLEGFNVYPSTSAVKSYFCSWHLSIDRLKTQLTTGTLATNEYLKVFLGVSSEAYYVSVWFPNEWIYTSLGGIHYNFLLTRVSKYRLRFYSVAYPPKKKS